MRDFLRGFASAFLGRDPEGLADWIVVAVVFDALLMATVIAIWTVLR